jgi:DNA uptake protein ComE-like DNA-binding protein
MKIPAYVKKWFGYNRKERSATIILLILIVLIILFRAFLPKMNMETEDLTPQMMALISSADREKNPIPAFKNPLSIPGNKRSGAYQQVENKNNKSYKRQPQVDLNKCDSTALESLPGIGPVLAVRILKYRNLLGGYASKEQLKEVYGLPPETFELIRDRVFAIADSVRKIEINKAGFKELSGMPYLENYDVSAILRYRKLQGKIQKMEELTGNRILTEDKALKLAPYFCFE